MRIIEGQEVIDEQLLPAGKHVAEETWQEFGVRIIEECGPHIVSERGWTVADALGFQNYLRYEGRDDGQIVKSTVVRLSWETAG